MPCVLNSNIEITTQTSRQDQQEYEIPCEKLQSTELERKKFDAQMGELEIEKR